jgi:hypothetical protein
MCFQVNVQQHVRACMCFQVNVQQHVRACMCFQVNVQHDLRVYMDPNVCIHIQSDVCKRVFQDALEPAETAQILPYMHAYMHTIR